VVLGGQNPHPPPPKPHATKQTKPPQEKAKRSTKQNRDRKHCFGSHAPFKKKKKTGVRKEEKTGRKKVGGRGYRWGEGT